jgi:hypothetical protein
MQIFLRIVHYVCALVSIYFVFKAFQYMIGTQGVPQWKDVSKFILLAVGFWLGGRGLRFMLGGE